MPKSLSVRYTVLVKYVLIFLVACAGALWLSRYVSGGTLAAAVGVAPVTIDVPEVAGLETIPATHGYAEIEGKVIIDYSSGTPGVPYIIYAIPGNPRVAKQLVFADGRGCYPNAGDIPCVPTYGGAAYPDLVSGQQIRVAGYIRADRFLITELRAR